MRDSASTSGESLVMVSWKNIHQLHLCLRQELLSVSDIKDFCSQLKNINTDIILIMTNDRSVREKVSSL